MPILSLSMLGCSSSDDAAATGDDANLTMEQLPVSNLMTDEQLQGDQDVTVEQVQAFLEKKRSYLATYEDDSKDGQKPAQIIVESSRAHSVSPIYMLARIQAESSLVESRTSNHLSAATGCACPDGKECSTKVKGFAAQIECAAALMQAYFKELDEQGHTRSGWQVHGKSAKTTLDHCSVNPENRATAALYTYTPWVGRAGRECGRRDILGSSFVASLFRKYSKLFEQDTKTASSP